MHQQCTVTVSSAPPTEDRGRTTPPTPPNLCSPALPPPEIVPRNEPFTAKGSFEVYNLFHQQGA